jgi:hypothetical protein
MDKYEIIQEFEKLSFWDRIWVATCDDFIMFLDIIPWIGSIIAGALFISAIPGIIKKIKERDWWA